MELGNENDWKKATLPDRFLNPGIVWAKERFFQIRVYIFSM
jgi:hypothetical protein